MNIRVYNALRKVAYEQQLGDRGANAFRRAGDAVFNETDDLAQKELALDRLNAMYEDLEHEGDTKGLNWGAAGSYGASMLGLGALGRLIAGKDNAGWGWGLGIASGALANYLRRKSYYGGNIYV